MKERIMGVDVSSMTYVGVYADDAEVESFEQWH